MRITSVQAPGKAIDERLKNDRALRKYIPIVSGLVLAGASCISVGSMGNPSGVPLVQGSASAAPAQSTIPDAAKPAQTEAPPAPQRECSAGVQSGKIDKYTKSKGAGVEIKVLLPAKGKYMLVSLPPEYVDDVNKASAGKSDAQADEFARTIFTRNIGRAFEGSEGKKGRFTFDCVLLTEIAPASPGKKAVVATEGDEAPAPPQPVPTVSPQPKKPEEAKPAAPAPTAEPSAPKKRTLNISDEGTAQAPKDDASKEFVGGAGKQDDPFVINVLRDRSTKEILGVKMVEFPMQMVGYFFTFRMTLNQLAKSKIEQTYTQILRMAKDTVARVERGKAQAFPNFPAFKAVVDQAFANKPEVKRYLETN